MKSLWVYIREKNLQDPENRRKIICDDALRGLLGCESTDMFQMNKLLSKHIWPLGGPKGKHVWFFTCMMPIWNCDNLNHIICVQMETNLSQKG